MEGLDPALRGGGFWKAQANRRDRIDPTLTLGIPTVVITNIVAVGMVRDVVLSTTARMGAAADAAVAAMVGTCVVPAAAWGTIAQLPLSAVGPSPAVSPIASPAVSPVASPAVEYMEDGNNCAGGEEEAPGRGGRVVHPRVLELLGARLGAGQELLHAVACQPAAQGADEEAGDALRSEARGGGGGSQLLEKDPGRFLMGGGRGEGGAGKGPGLLVEVIVAACWQFHQSH